MKRFAVLSIVALVSLYVPSAWTTAPSVSDLPDVRLLTGGTPKGVISSGQGLNSTEMNAYDLDEFIKDFDQAVGDLDISISNIQMADPPPSLSPNSDTPTPRIELDVDNNIDIYGRADAGWAIYTVEVDDTTPAHLTSESAVAKYSTFSLGTPSLSAGRFFNLSAAGWQLQYAWMGEDVVVTDLDSTLDPPSTTVSWEAYFNCVTYQFDANGNLLGINPVYLDHGADITDASGWNVSISSTGGLVLSPGSVYSPGPFLVGILALKDGTTDDMDGTRVMVSAGLLGLATPGEGVTITHEDSETLEGLSTGSIPLQSAPSRVPIGPGSHWSYQFGAADSLRNTAVPLSVVDLTSDSDLPGAAAPDGFAADGNGLKAFFDVSASPPPAARLYSRAIQPGAGAQPGEVYTFAANIATTVTEATNSPSLLMTLASGLGTTTGAVFINHQSAGSAAAGSVLEQYQKDIVPLADEGWQTLSVNFSPPATITYNDADGDGDMDEDDMAIIEGNFSTNQGFTDPTAVMMATLKVIGRADMTSDFYVFLDNLRVYKSAYELDLGLQKTEYNAIAVLTGILPPQITNTSGALDGTLESYLSDLEADCGLKITTGAGNAPPQRPAWWRVYDAGAGAVSVNTSVDHTMSNNSSNCLQIQLPAMGEGTGYAYKSRLFTTIVAAEGSGIYCLETFVAKQRGPTNGVGAVQTDQTPALLLALNQMAPNALQPLYAQFMNKGGMYDDLSAGWLRVVTTGYIRDAQLVRGVIAMNDSFQEPSDWFSVPMYIDDLRIYRVDDPAKFFDADLFDSI